MPPDGLLEVGRIGRPHGVRGDVFVDLTTDRTERVAVGSMLWARDRWLTVTASNASKHRWRVHFDGIPDRAVAATYAGATLYAEPLRDAEALWVHELIGASVIDTSGIDRGHCVAVIDNPAADLLELASGALVPATFVTSIETSGGSTLVTIDPPDGLFELYDA